MSDLLDNAEILVEEIGFPPELVDGMDDAIIGWKLRDAEDPVAVYSIPKIIDLLVEETGTSEQEMSVYFESELLAEWTALDHSPIFIQLLDLPD